ncbi:MAG: fibronectin type III domain-containing protein [Chitinophagaceae bacterium]|nr:fibronectin type III domain-containing protein [Chitinophagaceae bacterium]
MAYSILNPKYSFIQFGYEQFTEEQKNCYEEDLKNCLPIFNDSDLAFQVILKADTNEEAMAVYTSAFTSIKLVLLKGFVTEQPEFESAILKDFVTDDIVFVRRMLSDTEVLLYWPNGLPGFKAHIACGKCFQIGTKITTEDIDGADISIPSNCLYRTCDDCWTSLLEYSCDENSYGFNYCAIETFSPNKVRLPIYISRPQLKTDQSIYSRSNGIINILKATKKKEYEGETENLTEGMHEKIDIALDHDHVHITTKHYTGGIRKTGDYEIEWTKFLDYPIAPAQFKVLATPYSVKNDNCEVCPPEYELCPVPQNVFVDTITDDSATVHWDNVGGVAGYVVIVNGSSQAGGNSPRVIVGLSSHTEYTIQVVTQCLGVLGSSEPSEEIVFVTL